ncbi:serine hydrolase domain-containing protein [Paludibaculum fermentans]|uniref:Beta-lactamase family protein n=1 Tax=Paludibaculum fermentans TaxID=1473598 RepID=A0A7S7SMU4_PALFE|nr:serine hydrolase domain-containing protein [Paludibaculum fermentans]QOY90789.1 beta-lactamase family protein [Paludibaculum fermentans]
MPDRRHRTLRLLPAVLCAVICGSLGFGQQDAAMEKQMDSLFSKYGASTPGVAVGIVRDGKVVLLKGYGTASLEHGVPVTATTVFQAASVSKQFTAFAVYLLEKQGKLSLEDDIRTYLPELPDFGKSIRIKHLLAHTSGIRDQAALLTLAGWRMDDVMTTEQALRVIRRQRALNFEPGSAYLYSNSGYLLLAEIVRHVSGRTFAEFTRQNIFDPLHMSNTRFSDDHETIIKNRADSYFREKGAYKRVNLNDSIVGPSNLYTTAEDMAKWALNLEKPIAGDRELIAKFNEPSLLDNGDRVVYYSLPGDVGYYAKGQVRRTYRGLEVLSHGGHSGGFRSSFWRFPGQHFAFVLLSNDEHFAQLDHAEAVTDFSLTDLLQPKKNAEGSTGGTSQALPAAKASLSDFEGRFYSPELDATYTARVLNGKLSLTHLRHGDIQLTEVNKDSFTGRIEFPAQFEFQRDSAGQVVELRISNFGAKNVKFRKLPR